MACWLPHCSCEPKPELTQNECTSSNATLAQHPDWSAFQELAQRQATGVDACLQMVWQVGSEQKAETLLVKVKSDGTLLLASNTQQSPFSALTYPTEAQQFRFRLFVFPSEQSERSKLCSTTMAAPSYDCFGAGQGEACWFFLAFRLRPDVFSGPTEVIENEPTLLCRPYLRGGTKEVVEEGPTESVGAEASEPDSSEPVAEDGGTESSPEAVTETLPDAGVEPGPEASPEEEPTVEQPPQEAPPSPCKSGTEKECPWLVSVGGDAVERGIMLARVSNGDLVIAGWMRSTSLTFGSTTLKRVGTQDLFVARLDDKGNWKWAVNAGGSGANITLKGIGVDAQGNAYVSGYYTGDWTAGTATMAKSPIGGDVMFVAKIDSKGLWQWALPIRNSSWVRGGSLVVGANNTIFVGGHALDDTTFGSSTLVAQGRHMMFVAALDTGGRWQWVEGVRTSNTIKSSGLTLPHLAVNASNEVFVVGLYNMTTQFGSIQVQSIGRDDMFVAKLNVQRQWEWVAKAGSRNSDLASSIVLDPNGTVIVGGRVSDKLNTIGTLVFNHEGGFIAALDSKGSWQWAEAVGKQKTGQSLSESTSPSSLNLDAQGNLYVAGVFRKILTIGGATITTNGKFAAYIAKRTPSKQWPWVTKAGETSDQQDYPSISVAVAPDGTVYSAGSTRTPAIGSRKLSSSVRGHLFVGKNIHLPSP